jgi:hypothetical protein
MSEQDMLGAPMTREAFIREKPDTEPSIKVTKIRNRWHARLLLGDKVYDEMACEVKEDISWISREMLRWYDKCGGKSAFASAARKRHTKPHIGRVWYRNELQREKATK